MIEAAQVTLVADPATLAQTGAALVAEAITTAASARGAAWIALAGGETPKGAYEVLGRPPWRDTVPWNACFVFWSDERFVPLDDPASNYRLAKDALLDRVPIPADQVFPAPVDAPSPSEAAARYARLLERVPHDGGAPRFDLILLGLGEDGHTASLFPGDPVIRDKAATVRAVRGAKPPPDRLTFTLPVLNAARVILVLVQGRGKRDAFDRVRRGDETAPAAVVRPSDGTLRFIVDRAAAG